MRRATISDVARKAGVSTGTVSAVLNNRSSVRDETRERVLTVISDLGYQPAVSARILGSSHGAEQMFTKTIGLIIKEMDNPFYSDVIIGARETLEAKGYTPLICSTEGDHEKEGALLNILRERFVNGAIISPTLHDDVDLSHLFMLKRSGYPFVLLEDVPGLKGIVVSIDNIEAYRSAVSYLIDIGHRNIAHVRGPEYSQHARDRVTGMQQAFSSSSAVYREELVVPCGAHMEDGYRATLELFRSRPAGDVPTAVTCFNDQVALGALSALSELGLRVPDDVSVMGCDDIPVAAYLTAPLTTVKAPKREMGRRAAQILVSQLEGESEGLPERVILDAELVVRASTQPLNH